MEELIKQKSWTVRKWLESIENESVRESALANHKRVPDYRIPGSVYSAIVLAFDWSNTPEGYDFWRKLHIFYFDLAHPFKYPVNTNPKTVGEWLDLIPDETIRKRAIANAHIFGTMTRRQVFSRPAGTMYEAISKAFIWSVAREGHAFWREASKEYKVNVFKRILNHFKKTA